MYPWGFISRQIPVISQLCVNMTKTLFWNTIIYCFIFGYTGLEIIFWAYSSCGASGLNFSLVFTPVELVLKSGILKETKHIIQ